jgi:hypothetical protein
MARRVGLSFDGRLSILVRRLLALYQAVPMKALVIYLVALASFATAAGAQNRGAPPRGSQPPRTGGARAAAQAPREQTPRSLDLQLEMAIGLDNGPRTYIFGGIRGVCAQPSGEIVVIDKLDNTIRVFDGRGNFVREFAGHGNGRGQFIDPIALRVRQDLIEVADIANKRITSYGVDGRHLGDRPLTNSSLIPPNRLATLRHGWMIGATGGRYTPNLTESVSRVLVMGIDARRVDTLATFPLGWVLRTRSNLGLKSPGISVGPGGDFAAAGDSIVAIVNGYDGAIQWYAVEPSGLVELTQRELKWTPVRIVQADLAEIRRRVRSAQGIPNSEGVTLETPRYFGRVEHALMDDRGRVWLLLRNRYEVTDKLQVVGQEAADDALITLPPGFTLHCIANDRLYGSIRGQDDVPRVVVYRIVDPRVQSGTG